MPRLTSLLLAALFACSLVPLRADSAGFNPAKDTLAYVGTYTGEKTGSRGIYLFRLQTENNEVSQNILLVPLGLAAETSNPSFLALDARRHLVFAVNEQADGGVSSFAIDAGTGKLRLISRVSSRGAGPCHLALDPSGRNLVVSNYDSGSVAVIPVAEDGRLSAASCFIQDHGKGLKPDRQEGPHAHCATFSPDGRFVFVCDLGLDRILAFRFDAEHGQMTPADPAYTEVKPGSGPRHLVFAPNGRFAYGDNELASTVTTYGYDAASGKLTPLGTVSSLPEYFDGANLAAEIAVRPDGRFLYVSNRGNETVVLFGIDPDKGTLTYIEEQETGGKRPRHFGIDASAKHLAVANQDTNNILVCRIDPDNGRLKPSGVFADCPSPVCVLFVAPLAK